MTGAQAHETDIERQLALLLGRARELTAGFAECAAAGGRPCDGQERLPSVVERLRRSVVRPLAEALERSSEPRDTQAAQRKGVVAPAERADAAQAVDERLAGLTLDATRLRVRAVAPGLQEAVAALQDLACRSGAGDAEDRASARRAELEEVMSPLPCAIQSETDGPYLVTNVENLTDWLGRCLPSTPQMALCRCGQSQLKPLCDGTHAEIGFRTQKDPSRVRDRRDSYVGQQVTILDNRGTCQHSGLCTDRLATAFRAGQEPFVAPSGGRMDEIIRAVRDCPSGALSYAIDAVEARDEVDYHGQRDPGISVSRDGPYRITGAIALIDGAGDDESRNQGASPEHYALCRCGHSQNKPFCSGMHWYVEFKDPIADPERTPTVFEWCGGLPALTRMTRLFYEKYVPQDPLLAPLFANMSADHPQRVAKWLGEVFGGPPAYSEQYGGYRRMISQHVGKCLTEEWRGRWVALLLQSAREAGMPNDAEFASAFESYIEWGSRLAVENSQTNARPPEQMPMPRWDWRTGAGPPGSRISALAPETEADVPPSVLPAVDEPIRFEKHIKPLFRARDRQSMTFAFDLWAQADVTTNAEAILARLRNGTMPCDGAWPPEKVDVFQRWVDSGMTS